MKLTLKILLVFFPLGLILSSFASFRSTASNNSITFETQKAVDTDTITLEGVYTGKNLYVHNPGCEIGFSIIKKVVNGKEVEPTISDSNFEIDFVRFGLKIGDPIVVQIIHQKNCPPKVMNPEVLKP